MSGCFCLFFFVFFFISASIARGYHTLSAFTDTAVETVHISASTDVTVEQSKENFPILIKITGLLGSIKNIYNYNIN